MNTKERNRSKKAILKNTGDYVSEMIECGKLNPSEEVKKQRLLFRVRNAQGRLNQPTV